MNVRSIRFRLTVWYAGLLAALLVLFGGFIYFTLARFLENSLRDSLSISQRPWRSREQICRCLRFPWL